MSSALAIAAVTGILQQELETAVTDHGLDGPLGGNVSVTNLNPQHASVPGNGLNVFMYQACESVARRSEYVPAFDSRGERTQIPLLALDLNYMVTAYGSDDFHADLLLGAAMLAIHSIPVLDRPFINQRLQGVTVGALTLGDFGLGDQLENLRISPRKLTPDEVSRWWSAFQAPYRPSAFYQVSVVLLQAQESGLSAPPVLQRGGQVGASLTPPFPALTEAVPPSSQPSATLGQSMVLQGSNLAGTNQLIRLRHRLLTDPLAEIAPASGDDNAVTLAIPNDQTWMAGLLEVSLLVQRSGETFQRTTNTVALAIAPAVSNLQLTRVNGRINATLTVSPQVRPGQIVSFILGSAEVEAQPFNAATADLTFNGLDVPAGNTLFRLRVDGVESLYINYTADPPAFLNSEFVNVPA